MVVAALVAEEAEDTADSMAISCADKTAHESRKLLP
jgi:hypothetical protein